MSLDDGSLKEEPDSHQIKRTLSLVEYVAVGCIITIIVRITTSRVRLRFHCFVTRSGILILIQDLTIFSRPLMQITDSESPGHHS
jgi:hypothetical protein